MGGSGRHNVGLIMPVRIAGSTLVSTAGSAANAGKVDQTREDAIGESGRKPMGPVGRKHW